MTTGGLLRLEIMAVDYTTGLISCWRCDEANSSDAFVDQVTGYNLTPANSPGVTTGLIGGCRTFLAASSQSADISTASAPLLSPGTGDFTIGGWIYRTASISGYMLGRGISADGNSTVRQGYALRGTATSNLPLLQFGVANSNRIALFGTTAMTLNAWWFMVGTIERASNAKLYINGVEDASLDITALSGGCASIAPFTVGAVTTSAGVVAGYHTGRIDNVFYYNRALNAETILALYNSGAGIDPSVPSASVFPQVMIY